MYNQKTIDAWAKESSKKDIPYLEIGMCVNQQYGKDNSVPLMFSLKIANKVLQQIQGGKK